MNSASARETRGSSLLLAGRLLTKFVNFGVQVAVVRLLAKDDFGVFAYGLGVVTAGEIIAKLGLGRAAYRYVAMYLERRQAAFVVGTLALVGTMILTVGLLFWLLMLAMSGSSRLGFPQGDGARVVLILALLGPIQALDAVSIQTLACYGRAKQIFFRKNVIAPALKVAAVAAVFLAGGDSVMLAIGYVAGGAIGLLFCLQLTVRVLVEDQVLPLAPRHWRVEWRPLLSHAAPLITTDVFAMTTALISSALLFAMTGEAEVAAFRAVLPAAVLNVLVMHSFAILYTPAVVRMQTKNDQAALRDHFWQSCAWTAVLSFPIFAVSFGIAPDLVPLLFGQDYRDSAGVLAVLALGYYVPVCLAFNSETLQAFNQTRPILITNLLAMVLATAFAVLLIPSFGAIGAALAITVVRSGAALLRQYFLLQTTSIGAVPAFVKTVWLKIAMATGGVLVVGWAWQPPLIVQGLACAGLTLALVQSTARALRVQHTFPELLRLPLLRRLLAR